MKQVLITKLLTLLIASSCIADVGTKTIEKRPKVVVAVIDTGIDESLMSQPWVCKDGHKDFTGAGLKDNHGHGTHIAGLVEQYAKGVVFNIGKNTSKDIDNASADFCVIVIKYYDPKRPNSDNLANTIASFKWAIDQKVDIINYSGGGTSFSKEEYEVVEIALNKGIKFVAAAGNERSDIDKWKYYPAMYDDRIIRVGNLVSDKVTTKVVTSLHLEGLKLIPKEETVIERDIASSSNYGKSINAWEIGTKVLSRLPTKSWGYMTGTSQATAIKSGKIVREMLSK
jgi:subtilisin family serine protease